MAGPYARLPQDRNNNVYQFVSSVTKQSVSGSPSTSSVITLSPDTTTIEITVLGGQSANSAIIGKWGVASVTTSNFDWIVQSGQAKLLAVPASVFGSELASVAGANAQNGLYTAVAVKNVVTPLASVFTIEYSA